MPNQTPIDDFADEQAGSVTLSASEIIEMVRVQWKVVAALVAVAVMITLLGSLLVKSRYRANAVIQISSSSGQELRVDEVVDFDRLSQERTYAKTQIDLLRSRGLREEVLRRYAAAGYDDFAIADGGDDRLRKVLTVTLRKDSELVDVSITDTDPERAARLANLVTEVYRQQTLEGRRDSALEAKVWLQQQLTDYKQRIADESGDLIAYQHEHRLADADEEVTQLSASMGALNVAYGEITTQRVLLETTVASHTSLVAARSYAAVAEDMNTPLVNAITGEYAAAAAEHAGIAARYLEQMPERRQSEAKLEGVSDELRKGVERALATEKAQLEILRAKESSLAAALDGTKAELLDRKGRYEEYERLKLKLERSKKFYETLAQRDGELELAARTHLSNVRVIDDARPESKPISPNIPFNVLTALVLSAVLGSVIGFLIEYMNTTISTPFDVSTYLRVPFLGLVPRLLEPNDDRQRARYILDHRNSTPAEAIRAIRAVLELNPAASVLRRILVTSTQTGEGKTNTASNLAASFAMLGRRVLLIDADMRRPRMHHIFEIGNDIGLSAVLTGASLDDAVVFSGVPNLDVLPAGVRPDGPNELLASVAMSKLLDEVDQRYDLVLVDTPPAGVLSDAALLSKLVDGVVFVVREKQVSRWVARQAIFRLQQVGANVLGAVVNDVDLTARGAARYNNYYYDYQYQAKPDPADLAAK